MMQDKIFGIKMYPAGKTTNSENAPNLGEAVPRGDYDKVFKAMEDCGIPLLVHGETSTKHDEHHRVIAGHHHQAEREFLPVYEYIAGKFPHLTVVMEHISTKELASLITEEKYPNLWASVTVQHLMCDNQDIHT